MSDEKKPVVEELRPEARELTEAEAAQVAGGAGALKTIAAAQTDYNNATQSPSDRLGRP